MVLGSANLANLLCASDQISRMRKLFEGNNWDIGDSFGAGRNASLLYSTEISISYSSNVDEACYFPCVRRLTPPLPLLLSISL